MPDMTPNDFGLEDKSPQDLEARRREIRDSILRDFGTYENPDVPESWLREMAMITGTLRRKTAGPPKKPKGKAAAKPTTGDLMSGL